MPAEWIYFNARRILTKLLYNQDVQDETLFVFKHSAMKDLNQPDMLGSAHGHLSVVVSV